VSEPPDDDDSEPELLELVVGEAGRLDSTISVAWAELSRAQAQRLIEDGRVTLGGAVVTKSGARVRPGDAIEIRVPPPEPLELVAEPIPLSILYEDAEVIVIDKPAGMVVHPAPGHSRGTLVNALLFHCTDLAGIGGVLRPGIVHRLDKDTTGVMIATKTDRAHASLTAQFAAKSRGEPGGISREYLAITSPPPPAPTGTLRTAYGRHPIHRKKFTSKLAGGKAAVTHWRVLETVFDGDAALVQFVLETGRTHQIRVHASDAGWPLVGDPVYGHKPHSERVAEVARALGRQALHAHTLAFTHPTSGERMSFTAPVPADFSRAMGR
jgi:23S rRNA pseudouridine1911/1915/1917 synthase